VQLTPATGYNKDGEVIYWYFSSQLCTPWEGRLSWFDSHHANTLADVFPGFLRLLEDPHYGKAVSTSLYWYLRSNRAGAGAGPDGGLILSQAALERLSVTILRKKKCDVPKKAAKIIRAACKTLNIPTALPTTCSDIYVYANQHNWDSPRVIAEVRNSLVHPDDKKNISNIKNAYFESWNLAQHYIELFVLNLSRFNGSYKNRLTAKWRGEVEKTPWT